MMTKSVIEPGTIVLQLLAGLKIMMGQRPVEQAASFHEFSLLGHA
jgi:hypothetical protein